MLYQTNRDLLKYLCPPSGLLFIVSSSGSCFNLGFKRIIRPSYLSIRKLFVAWRLPNQGDFAAVSFPESWVRLNQFTLSAAGFFIFCLYFWGSAHLAIKDSSWTIYLLAEIDQIYCSVNVGCVFLSLIYLIAL